MPTVLLIGEGDRAEETRQALDAEGAEVYRMKAPEEREVKHALEGGGIDRVVVVSREDAIVLRTALMVRNVDEDVPMLVTIFDPTMAGQVDRDLERCDVTSMADIVGPSLAGPCLGKDLTAIREDADPPVGLRERDDGVEETAIEVLGQKRAAALASAIFAPYDKSAALLLWGALGLARELGFPVVIGRGAETRSLFRIGLVPDVHRIAAVLIAARATGSDATRVVCIGDEAHLLHDDGRLEEAAAAATT